MYEPPYEGTEFDKLFEPDPACLYCTHYLGDVCTKDWNNMDESYYIPERDDKEADECCDDYEWNGEELEEPKPPVKPKRKDFDSEGKYGMAWRSYKADMNLYNRWWAKFGWKYRRED